MWRAFKRLAGRATSDFTTTLTATSFLLVALSVAAAVTLSHISYTGYVQQRIDAYNERLSKTLFQYIDDYYSNIIQRCIIPLYSGELQSALAGENLYPFQREPTLALENLPQFRSFLSQLNERRLGLSELYLFCGDGRRALYFSKGLARAELLEKAGSGAYKGEDWYRDAGQSGDPCVQLSQGQAAAFGNPDLCYFVKRIASTRDGRELATLLFAIDIRYFLEDCARSLAAPEDHIVIMDEAMGIKFASGEAPEPLLAGLRALVSRGGSGERLSANGAAYHVSFQQSDSFDWIVCGLFSLNEIQQAASQLAYMLALMILAVIAVFFAVAFGAARTLSKPVRLLRAGMALVESGDLRARVPAGEGGEMNQLIHSFNHMVERLDDSIHRNYVTEIQKKEAQLLSLQNQIKPHFLYNALNSIQMMAILESDYKVSRMLTSLGDMLHYVMKPGDHPTLARELQIMDSYLAFQQSQAKQTVTVMRDVPDALLGEPCVKMLLQPLVENCFKHAQFPASGARIEVRAWATDGGYALSVADNGAGMDAEQLAALETRLISGRQTGSSDDHIGLSNVLLRLQFHFGPKSGLRLYSAPGKGLRVEVTLATREEATEL